MFRREFFPLLVESWGVARAWANVIIYVVISFVVLTTFAQKTIMKYRISQSFPFAFISAFQQLEIMLGLYAVFYVWWFMTMKPLCVFFALRAVRSIYLAKGYTQKERYFVLYANLWLFVFLGFCLFRLP